MSTDILERDGVHVTRFYGGSVRGRCYQITVTAGGDGSGYVQLIAEDAKAVALAILAEFDAAGGTPE